MLQSKQFTGTKNRLDSVDFVLLTQRLRVHMGLPFVNDARKRLSPASFIRPKTGRNG
jgi:hypothetical protein